MTIKASRNIQLMGKLQGTRRVVARAEPQLSASRDRLHIHMRLTTFVGVKGRGDRSCLVMRSDDRGNRPSPCGHVWHKCVPNRPEERSPRSRRHRDTGLRTL